MNRMKRTLAGLLCLVPLVLIPACSRERGDIPKRDLPEYFGVFSAGSGKRPVPLTASTQDVGPDLREDAVFVVHLQGLSRMGNPEERIRLLDRSLIRHEVERVKKTKQGEVMLTHLHPPREQFASFNKFTVRFRPAPKPDTLIIVPDEPLKPGLYTLLAEGEEYPFSVRLGSKALNENPHVESVDHYFVTLDSETGSPLEELLALSSRGLPFGGNRNSIGDNAILEDFYQGTALLDLEMDAHRRDAIAAWNSQEYMKAIEACLEARKFFPDDRKLRDILQEAPVEAAKRAMKQKHWTEANEWIERGRAMAPDKEKFETFAGKASFDCAMAEAEEHFAAGRFEPAALASGRAGYNQSDDRLREKANALNRNAWFNHHLAASRRAENAGNLDEQFNSAKQALEFDVKSSEARKLAMDAVERMRSNPMYYGQYFQVLHRIELTEENIRMIAFTEDGKRLHAYFDASPRRFVVWDVNSGREMQKTEVEDNFNSNIAPSMLASRLNAKGVDSQSVNQHMWKRHGEGSKEENPFRFIIQELDSGKDVCSIPVGEEFGSCDVFYSRSDRLLAVAPKTNEGKIVFINPKEGKIIFTVRMPFSTDMPPDQAQYGDRDMYVSDVVFNLANDLVAASNGYGVAVFDLQHGKILHSGKNSEIVYLLGVSPDGKEIALSLNSSFMGGYDWHLWNLIDGSEPRKAHEEFGRWKMMPDLKAGFLGTSNGVNVFVAGMDEPRAEFGEPKPKDGSGFAFRMSDPTWDYSPDGRNLAIASGDFLEIWGVQPPFLPE